MSSRRRLDRFADWHEALKGATGYGGPCFPRDNAAFGVLARSLGARAKLAEATDTLNRYQVERVMGAVEARMSDSGSVGVLRLSYKPDTAVVEESQGLALVERLLDLGRRVIAYDPKALPTAQRRCGRSRWRCQLPIACAPRRSWSS